MTDYIIEFWDKSKIRITEDMATNLKAAIQADSIKHFMLDSSLYAVSGVEKIIPVEEAYLVYPEENQRFQTMETKKPSDNFIKLGNNQKQLS